MTVTTAPNTGHQTFLYSRLATDLDRLDADIAFLGIPYGSAYSFAEIVNDQSNMPAAMRRGPMRSSPMPSGSWASEKVRK